ncbi:UNVERIFIED_CONTAM: hypothetical protein Sangu_1605700 [Sesamum angustifolium]|uniref:Uncharacterized protein n=1 Tax=Sesamum angustifolium TaxID=2727405 RepID=A0AAW2MGF7_9LAMI
MSRERTTDGRRVGRKRCSRRWGMRISGSGPVLGAKAEACKDCSGREKGMVKVEAAVPA